MFKSILTLALLSISLTSHAKLCSSWSEPEQIGGLDTNSLPEASGLAISTQFSDRLYHINDAGNEPDIYVTDMAGNIEQTISVKGMAQKLDTEELSSGKCGNETCIFVGNIGDNDTARAFIEILWFKEKESYKDGIADLKKLKLTYPDGPHNAEGFFVHPSGDIFLFTKEGGKPKELKDLAGSSAKAKPASVFRIPASVITKGSSSFTMEKVGEIDVASYLSEHKSKNQIVTGASISSDGERALLLTYSAVIEIPWNIEDNFKKELNFNVVDLSLEKQEAVAFLPDSSGFIVTTEGKKIEEAPIMQINCSKI